MFEVIPNSAKRYFSDVDLVKKLRKKTVVNSPALRCHLASPRLSGSASKGMKVTPATVAELFQLQDDTSPA